MFSATERHRNLAAAMTFMLSLELEAKPDAERTAE